MIDYKILDQAIKKWGEGAQVLKAIEEFSELNVELAKYANGLDCDGLIGELADATIMIEQLSRIFCIHNNKDLCDTIKRKMRRLVKKIEQDKP